VVVRRWVARWLLNEIGRALDPVAEFADRARILGLGVVELVAPPSV
jgi:predicted regulator of amino acid metabolism with ACT domain